MTDLGRIADALHDLAEAQWATARAESDLVNLRKSELEAAERSRATVLAANASDRGAIKEFRDELMSIEPALRMLVSIARAMRGSGEETR